MPIWIAIVLGIVQGLTEFLPVSSSGHLALAQELLSFDQYMQSSIAFNLILHLGTLLAVVLAFWKDIVLLWSGFTGLLGDRLQTRGRGERRLVWLLLVATLPLAVGALIDGYVESAFSSTLFVGCALLITAVMLFFADRCGGGNKDEKTCGIKDAATVGIFQLIAVFPGISRSGATISAGLFSGLKKDFAVRFAFLLSIPAVLGASVFELPDALSEGWSAQLFWPCAAGFFAALVSGYLAIRLLRLLVRRNSFYWFSIYCAVVGAITIACNLL